MPLLKAIEKLANQKNHAHKHKLIMKKFLLAFALFAGVASISNTAQAQVSVSFNIGSQPLWGPTGYDYAEYYYLPDIDAYYNVNTRQFIYENGGSWGYYNSLPYRYRNYDLYNGYKVVINDRDPWRRNNYYNRQYRSYRGHYGQSYIRNSNDNRYWANPNHPNHSHWSRDGAKSNDVRYNNGGRYDNRNDYGHRNDGYRNGHDRNYGNGNNGGRDGGRREINQRSENTNRDNGGFGRGNENRSSNMNNGGKSGDANQGGSMNNRNGGNGGERQGGRR